MLYNPFQDLSLSALGFGAMRLPLRPDGTIDAEELDRMVDAAIAAGVNYFDTAHPYHDGKSEVELGRSLRRYPRESWYLADKFPGHQNVPGVTPLDPGEIFEEQLQRCGVDYFDFYLLHNVNENSLRYYGNPENRFMDYFLAQKRAGRIRHLGFSCHAAPAGLEHFLRLYGEELEFCQIQLNYLDWTLQDAKQKVAILKNAGLPVWVMEPVRGGRLAHFDEATEAKLRAARPDESIPAWAFRWLRTVPQPTVILSGMSNLEQMEDNLKTFSEHRPLNGEELALLKQAFDEKNAAWADLTDLQRKNMEQRFRIVNERQQELADSLIRRNVADQVEKRVDAAKAYEALRDDGFIPLHLDEITMGRIFNTLAMQAFLDRFNLIFQGIAEPVNSDISDKILKEVFAPFWKQYHDGLLFLMNDGSGKPPDADTAKH